MATTNLGRIGFVPKGDFVGGTTYKYLDVVRYGTASYICKVTTTIENPTNTNIWTLLNNDATALNVITGTATNISGIVKGSAGTLSAASSSTDYQLPIGNIAGLVKGNGANALTLAQADVDYITPTGTGTLSGKTITGVKETKTAPAITSGVVTLNCNTGNMFAISLNANITSFTVSNVPATGTFYLCAIELTADGTARTVTWSLGGVTVKWAGGTAPTLTSASGKKDTFILYTHDGGTNWLGFKAGQNL